MQRLKPTQYHWIVFCLVLGAALIVSLAANLRSMNVSPSRPGTAKNGELIAEAPKGQPILTLEPKTIDLGDVPQKGIISRNFQIQNKGGQDLVIRGLESSCGCTSARIINQGVEGPVFGMEGHAGVSNPKGWSTTIRAGQKAILRVSYDPTQHPGFTGPATRLITILSNDPINPRIEAMIELNQL